MREDVKQNLRLYLVLVFLSCATSSETYYKNTELFEGSACQLASGEGNGTCVKMKECQHQIRALLERRFNPKDRCVFDHDEDIVCCGSVKVRNNPNGDTNQSPADAACARYGNEVLPTEDSRVGFYILNGENAKTREFPYMVALGYAARPNDADPNGIAYTCGGTLISERHVLTAAHCISNRDERIPVEVRLGSTDLATSEDTVQRLRISSVTPHPAYKRSANYDDIAIITLNDSVRLTPEVRPVCLLTRSKHTLNPAANETLVVLGWGATSVDFDETTQLKKAAGLVFVDSAECDRNYENARATKMTRGIDEKMICAIGSNQTHRADACWGDSGGPLLLFSGSTYKLAGVTAFGQACGSIIPSVYMSVYSYMDWIEEHVWQNVEEKQ